MDKEEIVNNILSSKAKNILLELPTGIGKTKIALQLMKLKCKPADKILVVVPRLVLIDNWKKEITKWRCKKYLPAIQFVTYVSFPKLTDTYDLVIFDECHHLSERCRQHLADKLVTIKESILLSATVNRDIKEDLLHCFIGIKTFKVTAKQAIQAEILPDPKVILIPLFLNRINRDCTIVRNPKKSNTITCNYEDRFKHIRNKTNRIEIKCTQAQYYSDISQLIEYYKKRSTNKLFKNLWLSECGKRLKWLSEIKTEVIKVILSSLEDQRTLTFCNSISQTEELGKYCINSKNKESDQNLQNFNKGKINHITACDMLNEGVNLTNCRIGIYAALNSSERIIKQKLGRLLRHPNPVLIIPYYKNTRDEEIVFKMCEDYNKDLITTVHTLDISQYI